MIAFRVPESFDVLAIPSGWDCFCYRGWLYRRRVGANGLFMFYQDEWIGYGAMPSRVSP